VSIPLPSRRALLITWLSLMGATIGAMGAGRVGQDVSLGPVWLTLLLALAGLKAGLVLWFYLNLHHSSPGWKKGFALFIFVILAFVWGAYLLTPTV